MVAWCNLVIDGVEDMAEFDEVTTHPQHVALRKQIMEHVCEQN